jgi:hypothetical protein
VLLRTLLCVTVLAVSMIAPAAAAPQIIEVYPDPPTPDDQGEWIIIDTDGRGDLRVDDGEGSTAVPDAGIVILSDRPGQIDPPRNGTRLHTEIRLANRGETVRLLAGDRIIDQLTYERARSGVRYHHAHGPVPVGVTPRAPTRHTVTALTPLVYPDAAGVLERHVAAAGERLIIGCYTYASPS